MSKSNKKQVGGERRKGKQGKRGTGKEEGWATFFCRFPFSPIPLFPFSDVSFSSGFSAAFRAKLRRKSLA